MAILFDARYNNREYGYWDFRTVAGGSPSHVGDARDTSGVVVASAPVPKADSQVPGFRAGDIATRFTLDDWAATTNHAHEFSTNFWLASQGAWDGVNGFMGTTMFYGLRHMVESPYSVPTAFMVIHQINYPTVLFSPAAFNLNPLISTTLTAQAAANASTITVADRTNVVNFDTTLKIDNEWLLVTAGGGTTGPGTLTVTRSVAGTAAALHLNGATVQNSAITMDLNYGKAVQSNSLGSTYHPVLGWQVRRWPVDTLHLNQWFEVIYEIKYATGYGTGGYIKVYYRLADRANPPAWQVVFDSRTNNYNTPDFTTTGSYDAGGTPTMQWGVELGTQGLTHLAADITFNATTITTADTAAAITNGDIILIDNELIKVGTVSSTTLSSCTRGYDSTTAAAHTSGGSTKRIDKMRYIDTHGQIISAGSGTQGIIDHLGAYRGGATKLTGTTQQTATIVRIDRTVQATSFAEVEANLNGVTVREPHSFFPTTPKYTGTLGTTTHTNPEIRCKVTTLPDSGNHVELRLCLSGTNCYQFWLYNDPVKGFMALMYEVLSNVPNSFGMTNPFNDAAGNTFQVNDWIGASVRLDPNAVTKRVLRFWWRRAASTTWTVIGSAISLNQTIPSPTTLAAINVAATGTGAFDANVMGGTGSILVAA